MEPEVGAELEHLDGIPKWQFLARPCVSHTRVHYGEVTTQLEVIRAAAPAGRRPPSPPLDSGPWQPTCSGGGWPSLGGCGTGLNHGFPALNGAESMVEARIDEKDSATVDGGFVVIGLGADGRRGSDSACGHAADVPGRVQPASG